MRLLQWALFLVPILADPSHIYDSAMQLAATLPDKYASQQPIYDHTNLHGGVHIPQFDPEKGDYMTSTELPETPSIVYSDILPKLREAAGAGYSPAAAALGDIYTFGNFSVPANYSKALEYYHAAVSKESNAHAYFMLGMMYSTGMFGETPVDSQKSSLYYEFAAKNGDTNALLTLAYKYLYGVGCSADCEVASFYYSTIARQVMKSISESDRDPDIERINRDIYLADFNGGTYGEKISESESSVISKIDEFVSVRETIRDNYIDAPDSSVVDYYFDAVQNYHGGYFFPQNYTKAYLKALTCAYLIKESSESSHSLSKIDEYMYGKCQGLVGRMYLKGLGTERDLNRAHHWLQSAASLFPDKENQLDLALLHSLDPVPSEEISPKFREYLTAAVGNDSVHALYLYARHLIAPRDPFQTSYTERTFGAMKNAAFSGHHEAVFYLVDAIESGVAASVGSSFTCSEKVQFLKSFVDRSERILLPHLDYAFEEFRHGNYKNALLGYSMAAEQGLVNAQLSASFLLFQRQPLITRNPKSFTYTRVKSALTYLESASAQGHVDSTLLLGDLYSEGVPAANISVDNSKAFAYYDKAASAASAHGCYKIGYMYEYGLGSANNTVDYYMAKRYYDLSFKYYQDLVMRRSNGEQKANTYAVGIALLRLKLKTLFNRSEKSPSNDEGGWFSTLKNLAKVKTKEAAEDSADSRAKAHYEGTDYEGDDQPLDTVDYVVLFFVVGFFAFVSIQSFYTWLSRGNANGEPDGGLGQFRVNVGNARAQLEVAFAL